MQTSRVKNAPKSLAATFHPGPVWRWSRSPRRTGEGKGKIGEGKEGGKRKKEAEIGDVFFIELWRWTPLM